MNVLLVAIGSDGDLHPVMALGLGLKARGHRVTVLANSHFEPVVRRVGLDFLELGTKEELQAVIDAPEAWDPTGSVNLVVDWCMLRLMRRTFSLIEERHVRGETVVVAPPIALGARIAQEALAIPLVTLALHPSLFRSATSPPSLPPLPVSGALPAVWNRFCYWAADYAVFDRLIGPLANRFRKELGLPPVHRFLAGWCFSPLRVLGLFPDWFAEPVSGWPPQTRLTGFPLYDGSGGGHLAPEVAEFLGVGAPPVVFTAGSANRHAHAFFTAAADACRRSGRRAVLVTRFRDQVPATLPSGVRHFDSVPFGQLFPLAAAVVHHGGIGTSALGLAAGTPQIVMPMAYDQHDNAARLGALGVARSLPVRQFKGPALAATIDSLLNSRVVTARCQTIADRMRHNEPLVRSVRLIEEALNLDERLRCRRTRFGTSCRSRTRCRCQVSPQPTASGPR